MPKSMAGDLLREARRRAGISQAELGRRAGVSRSVVNVYERGTREPGTQTLTRLLAAAGLELRLVPASRVDVVGTARTLTQARDLAEWTASIEGKDHEYGRPLGTHQRKESFACHVAAIVPVGLTDGAAE